MACFIGTYIISKKAVAGQYCELIVQSRWMAGVGYYNFVYSSVLQPFDPPLNLARSAVATYGMLFLFLSPCQFVIAGYATRTSSGANSLRSAWSCYSAYESRVGREPNYLSLSQRARFKCQEQRNKCPVLYLSQEISPLLCISIRIPMHPERICRGMHTCCLNV